MTKQIIISGLVFVVLYGGILLTSPAQDTYNVGGSFTDTSCAVTETVATVGHQESTQLLATTSLRAWATIQQPVDATNTVSVALDGSAAVAGNGYLLHPATTTESAFETPYFGLNTSLPHTGRINAITNSGSTTVNVIECKY